MKKFGKCLGKQLLPLVGHSRKLNDDFLSMANYIVNVTEWCQRANVDYF